MKIYKRCLQLSKQLKECKTDEIDSNELFLPHTELSNTTIPQVLQSETDYYKRLCNEIYYISDIHLVQQILNNFKKFSSDKDIECYVKGIAQNIFTKDLCKSIQGYIPPIVIFGGDISSIFEIAEIFYTEFINKWNNLEKQSEYRHKKRIFAVLGNHDFWSFKNADECYDKYTELFNSLGIRLLNNNGVWLKDTALLIGGTGFASQNTEFNADDGIYRMTINRDEEIEESEKWIKFYNKALDSAKKKDCVLVVVTHNPISDWKNDKQPNENCVYFYGHTHRNYIFHDDENNIHIFADNQIGNIKRPIKFKSAYVYNRMNPFANYIDGYYEISSSDYIKFYSYLGEVLHGNGHVDRMVESHHAKFYMIKQCGFYGFFLLSSNASYICAGGRIKKICGRRSIERFNDDFLQMIRKYLKILSPYRNAQEQLSNMVKSFGGSGKIHGCIVDIDFYHHIMLNPEDGTITFYYSPVFGVMEIYKNMMELLESRNEKLAKKHIRQFKMENNSLMPQCGMGELSKLIKIDIKNSPYSISNKMNQLQKLFSKGILRDWNDNLLLDDDNKIEASSKLSK